MTAQRNASGKFTKKATAIDTEIKDLEDKLHTESETLWARMGFRPYSMQSTVLKLITRIAMYSLGFVGALYAVSYLSAILMTAGWPLFLIAVIELFSIIMAAIASWHVSDTIIDFVADGGITKTTAKVGGWLKSKFTDASTVVKSRMAMH